MIMPIHPVDGLYGVESYHFGAVGLKNDFGVELNEYCGGNDNWPNQPTWTNGLALLGK